jgi:hypothetical protein
MAVVVLTMIVASHSSAQMVGTLEDLLGFRTNGYGVMIEVTSSGCTTKRDFRVEVARSASGTEPFHLTVVREREDPCDGVQRRRAIRFAYPELGLQLGDRLVVVNAVLASGLTRPH